MESEQLHRAANGARAFAASLPPENQLRMTTVAEWDRMVDALDQAERTLDWLAASARFWAARPTPRPLTLNRGMLTSIGIALAKIRRAR